MVQIKAITPSGRPLSVRWLIWGIKCTNAAMLAKYLLIYSRVAGRIERSWISGPIVFTRGWLYPSVKFSWLKFVRWKAAFA